MQRIREDEIVVEIDPVCGTRVEKALAAATTTYRGKMYYFDSESCRQTFDRDPEHYISEQESAAPII